jgi:hypothetical protein
VPHDPPPPPLQQLPPARRPFNKENIEVFNLGRMNIQCSSCSALHWDAERLSKSTALRPLFGSCCLQGKIALPPIEPIPIELRHLYDGNDHQSKKFRENIRTYNSALAMTSVGQSAGVRLNVQNHLNQGGAPWVYKIQGACHHITGALLPAEGGQPSYAQLYIWDPAHALDIRMNNPANRALD